MNIHTQLLLLYICSQTQQTKQMFEDLIAKQARAARRDSPLMHRQRMTKPPTQRVKERPRLKPDSVIQKLLEKFDPTRLTGTSKVWHQQQVKTKV